MQRSGLKLSTAVDERHAQISLAIRVLAVMMSLFMFAAGAAARIGMDGVPNIYTLAMSVCLILFPDILHALTTWPAAFVQLLVLAIFLILGWISIVFDINLSFIVVVTSIICLLYLFRCLRNVSNRISLKASVPYIALGLTVIGLVWTQDYMNPLFPEAFATGFGFIHTDTLFHAALTSNIRTYSAASTGLFGLEPMTYHHGAHYLLAAYSRVCEMGVIEFYSSGYPVIFVPLFFKTLLDAALSEQEIRGTTAVITVGIILFYVINGFYPFDFGMRYLLPAAVNTHFLSQSYCISLILTFLFIQLYSPILGNRVSVGMSIRDRIFILLIPVWFVLIGYTKVSTAVVIMAAFFYLVLRRRLFLQKSFAIATVVSMCSLYVLFQLTIEREESNFQIQPGSYYQHFIQGNLFIYFFSYYLFFALLTVIVMLIKRNGPSGFLHKLISGDYLILELILVAAFIGVLPGFLIYIDGGSAYYFSDVQYWLTAVALIHYAPKFRRIPFVVKFHRGLRAAYLIIAAVMITKAAVEIFSFARRNLQIRTSLAYGHDVHFKDLVKSTSTDALLASLVVHITESPQYRQRIERSNLELLESLRSLPRSVKSRAVIFCEDPEQLGQFLNCGQAVFYMPALGEIALINGLYWRDQCNVLDEYGMRAYNSYPSKVPFETASKLAASQGFRYLIKVNLGNDTFSVEDLRHQASDNVDL